MTLENKIIQRYRLHFPNETLREVSQKTGIQITRVFRLFNGKKMKVSELEAFEAVIQGKKFENQSFNRLNRIAEEASSLLTHDEMDKITDYIERKLTNKKFSRTYINYVFNDAIIA